MVSVRRDLKQVLGVAESICAGSKEAHRPRRRNDNGSAGRSKERPSVRALSLRLGQGDAMGISEEQ
jgi:hypothetical protein